MLKNLLLFILIFPCAVLAQKTDVNRVLFSIGTTSWTSRDREVYQFVLNEVFQKKALSQYSKNPENDFLLSRLSYKEAAVFELSSGEKNKMADLGKKLNGFSATEVERETDYISKALILIEIKESQHKDSRRFNSWFDLLKRKYLVRLK